MNKGILVLCLSFFAMEASAAEGLFSAIAQGDLQAVREMVGENPGAVNIRLPHSYTPLLLAADQGRDEIVLYLLAKGAQVDDVWMPHYGYTALTYCIRNNNLGMVKALVENGLDLQYATDQGETYLHFAAAHNRADIAAFLIDGGVPVDSQKKGALTPLHIAAIFGRKEAARGRWCR